MQEFNAKDFRVSGCTGLITNACVQFKYKGYEISISNLFKNDPSICVFNLQGDTSTCLGEFNSVERAIKWVDMQVEKDPRKGRELSLCQFQGTAGDWHAFMNEEHYRNTLDAGYPIRYLSVD